MNSTFKSSLESKSFSFSLLSYHHLSPRSLHQPPNWFPTSPLASYTILSTVVSSWKTQVTLSKVLQGFSLDYRENWALPVASWSLHSLWLHPPSLHSSHRGPWWSQSNQGALPAGSLHWNTGPPGGPMDNFITISISSRMSLPQWGLPGPTIKLWFLFRCSLSLPLPHYFLIWNIIYFFIMIII